MKTEPAGKPNSLFGAMVIGVLPFIYFLAAPAAYVAGDKLGVAGWLLESFCAPYDWLEQNTFLWKLLTNCWMLWMRIGYGN